MSHIVQIQTEVRDQQAVQAACQRLGWEVPLPRTVKLFSGEATGLAIVLPGWRYPVVADLSSGQLAYDNFQGRWGAQSQLDLFMQTYAVEKTKLAARQKGHTVLEQALPDGSIKLTLMLGGSV